jgi:large subunit ribosomal protein L4
MKWTADRLLVLEDAGLKEAKTKEAAGWVKSLHLDSALIVDRKENRSLFRALNNIPRIRAIDAAQLSAFDVLSHEWLVLTRRALESLGERFKK